MDIISITSHHNLKFKFLVVFKEKFWKYSIITEKFSLVGLFIEMTNL